MMTKQPSDRPSTSRRRKYFKVCSLLLLIVVILGGGIVLEALMHDHVTESMLIYESCKRCGAMRQRESTVWMGIIENAGPSEVIYESEQSSTCEHTWTLGGRPDGVLIRSGQVLLMCRGNALGALIPRDIASDGIGMPYEYIYRSDGKSTLDPTEQSMVRGISDGSPIRCGPFTLRCSRMQDSDGSIAYFFQYPRRPDESVTADDTAICATDRTAFDGLDASTSLWTYRASCIDKRYERPAHSKTPFTTNHLTTKP